MNCLLCHTFSDVFLNTTFKCPHCHLIFKDPSLHISHDEDFVRYSSHQNNNDQGYIDFLNRLLIPLNDFLPPKFSAIDFGCGPGPTLSKLLQGQGGEMTIYDPHFFPDEKVLGHDYDVVTSTEVVEHFKTPKKDWAQLINLAKPNGLIAIMTQFFNDQIDYSSWWYKNDPTHVVFYQQKTFDYLAEKFHLKILYNDNKSVIIFRKLEVI